MKRFYLPHKKDAGFTLLEVMLSLSIVSIALVFILRSFIKFADSQATLTQYTKGCYLLDKKLAEIKSKPIGAFPKSGQFTKPFEAYNWEIDSQGMASTLNRVKLTVSWQKNNGVRSIDVTTIYPEPSSP
ncbi:MAG: prepilin-type N-terminal cleavage/methylation domain-containing protein [Candidatus Omnitrophica bacterium]|nr:prepilin-type N-terminal cleavage/methylation domain-containing protein [Candidatus Omnitrophota bacterium]